MKKFAETGMAAAFLLAAAASQASAQSVFDGAYYGGGIGFATATTTEPPPDGYVDNYTGAFGSLIVGWNGSSGNFVYGAEADLSAAAISGDAPCDNPAWTCEAEVKAFGSLRARVGIDSGGTLFFGTAGVAAARVELATIDVGGGGTRYPDTQNVSGWVIGIGAERPLPSGWNLRGEILHYEFNKKDYTLDVPYLGMETDMTGLRVSMTRKF